MQKKIINKLLQVNLNYTYIKQHILKVSRPNSGVTSNLAENLISTSKELENIE